MKFLRVILALVMLSSLSLAEEDIKEQRESLKGKGFFVGLDIESIKADGRYSSNLYNYSSEVTKTEPAFKLGYQYYFTRVYFKYSEIEESYSEYSVDSTSYELNFEYIPVLYRENTYALRLIAGVSMGYSDNEMKNLNSTLDAYHQVLDLTNFSQSQALYGVQIGLMFEMTSGLSAELGYRYRRGNLLEFEDDAGDITVETKRKQLYLGLNYMF